MCTKWQAKTINTAKLKVNMIQKLSKMPDSYVVQLVAQIIDLKDLYTLKFYHYRIPFRSDNKSIELRKK